MNVAIVDSGGANIGSVRYALNRLGADSLLTADHGAIVAADRVILPGVGAAAAGMSALRRHRLDNVVPRLTQPVLGICLGMQLMFESSAEADTACLGIFDGRAVRFAGTASRRVPHMGWNQLTRLRDDPLLDGIGNGDYAYFVHSYALPVSSQSIASCDYGDAFAAIAQRDNFRAAQFHPERSAAVGAQLLQNFLRL